MCWVLLASGVRQRPSSTSAGKLAKPQTYKGNTLFRLKVQGEVVLLDEFSSVQSRLKHELPSFVVLSKEIL